MSKKRYIPMNETKETKDEVVEVVEETKEESKMKEFVKNNWKKFAVGAGVVLAGVGGFLLGSNVSDNDDLEFINLDEDEESEETETSEE